MNVSTEKESFNASVDKLFEQLWLGEGKNLEYYQAKIDLIVERTSDNIGYLAYKLYICQAMVYALADKVYDVIKVLEEADKVRGEHSIENVYSKAQNNLLVNAKVRQKELFQETARKLEVHNLKISAIGCFLAGLGFLIIGGIITGITYSEADPGGTYTVTTGLFIVGALNILIGIGRGIKWIALRN